MSSIKIILLTILNLLKRVRERLFVEKLTERCLHCGLFAGSAYGSDYYKLADEVYCSLNCFYENDQRDKELKEYKTIITKAPSKKKKKVKSKKRKK